MLSSSKAFASDLQAKISSKISAKESLALIDTLEKEIKSFPSGFGSYALQKYEDLDSNGTTLWNKCTRLRRDCNAKDSDTQQLALLMTRVYAFLLLDCAQSGERGTISNVVRLFKIGLKAAKCSTGRHLDRIADGSRSLTQWQIIDSWILQLEF